MQPKVIGKCYRKIKDKICGGNVIESRIPQKRFDKIIGPGQDRAVNFFVGPKKPLPNMIFGPGEFAGYICTKCGKQYAAPPLDPKLLRLFQKKLKRMAELNQKRTS